MTACSEDDLTELRGIGEVRAGKILEGLTTFKAFITAMGINMGQFEAHKEINEAINGKTFVLTNLEDDNLEDFIIDNGGKIGTKVTAKTTALISGNIQIISEKQIEAHKMDIQIFTLTEFSDLYGYR
jgi:NAD-dependent DNA ligase